MIYPQSKLNRRKYIRYRLSRLALSRHVTTNTSQLGGIKWLDLDNVEQRYLLSASADSTVEAFDVLSADAGTGYEQLQLQPLFTIKRSHPAAHRYQVTSVTWYSVDTGMFITGSADKEVKLWDTNVLEVACAFNCPDKVMAVAMSSCASSHALIAVGTNEPGVVLADIVSGAFTHTLTGHRSATWSICWSPSIEHQLFTGDASGEVRLWDVRRSGCQALLDLTVTHRPKPARPHQNTRNCSLNSQQTSSGSLRGTTGSTSNTHSRTGSGSLKRKHSSLAGIAELHAGPEYESSRTPATWQVAHEGAVTGILATSDGLHLVTAGGDSRARLWDSHYRHQLLVHYSNTYNIGSTPKKLSSTPDGRYLFHPRGADIQVFDITTGQLLTELSQGHYDIVTSCVYSPLTGHLWSASTDGAILVWEPWTEPEHEPEQQQEHHLDWWLALASGRRGHAAHVAGPAATGAASGAGGRMEVPLAADVDAWSTDYELT